MKKIFTLLLLIICFTSVKAYENQLFKITIPEGYTNETKDNIYKWTKDKEYISITISDNTSNYNIREYTDEDLKRQKTYLESIYSNRLQDYNMTTDVSEVERSTVNDYSILVYNVYWPSKDLTGYNIYQKGAVYTTQNYIYTILISNDSEITDDEFYGLLKTFELKDEEFPYRSKLTPIILIGGTILGVIGYFVDKKKKEHK